MDDELVVLGYREWMDAANTATERLFDAVHMGKQENIIRLYEVLSIASSLCAVAAAIKERK